MIQQIVRAAVALCGGAFVLSACAAPAGTGDEALGAGPLEVVIGFGAGGSTDINTRALANIAQETCDTNILISNQPGGNGVNALQTLRTAETDGKTLGTTPTELNSLEHRGISAITYEDYAPIIRFGLNPHAFVVPASSSLESVEDLIDALNRGEHIKVGTTGAACNFAYTYESLAQEIDAEGQFVNIPYAGGVSESIPAVLSGEVDLIVVDAATVLTRVEEGEMRALAVAGEERLSALSDVPTLLEKGYDVTGASYFGLAAPAGTSEHIIEELSRCFAEAYETEQYQSFLLNQGAEYAYMDHDEFNDYLAEEYERYSNLVESLGL